MIAYRLALQSDKSLEEFRGSPMAGRRWAREEDLAVLFLRRRRVRQFDPAIAELAGAMQRTEASIWMHKGNFDSLDPCVPGVGLRSASKLTKNVWAEGSTDLRVHPVEYVVSDALVVAR